MYKFRGNKTKRILSLFKHKARSAREILETIIPVDPDTYKVTKNLLGYMDVPKFNYLEWKRKEEKRFYALFAKLRKEGLIQKKGTGMTAIWQLTKNGLKKLIHYARQKSPELPKKTYKKEKINDEVLIIFDIPEKLKYKRAWLRHKLKMLGFDMLQKSVWIGTYAVPADFIRDLRRLNLLQYIHIFKISKTGSIIK